MRVCDQTSVPVSASSATTRRPLETYMVPLMTSGTEEAPPVIANVHACRSVPTFAAVICVSGE